MSVKAPKAKPQAAVQPVSPPIPAPTPVAAPLAQTELAPAPTPTVYRPDGWAFAFWSGCALLLAVLVLTDLILSLIRLWL